MVLVQPRHLSHWHHLHLATILPTGNLIIWQLILMKQHRALIVHRINGYLVTIPRHCEQRPRNDELSTSARGSIVTSAGFCVLVTVTTLSIDLIYYNLKLCQVDQHSRLNVKDRALLRN